MPYKAGYRKVWMRAVYMKLKDDTAMSISASVNGYRLTDSVVVLGCNLVARQEYEIYYLHIRLASSTFNWKSFCDFSIATAGADKSTTVAIGDVANKHYVEIVLLYTQSPPDKLVLSKVLGSKLLAIRLSVSWFVFLFVDLAWRSCQMNSPRNPSCASVSCAVVGKIHAASQWQSKIRASSLKSFIYYTGSLNNCSHVI